MEYVLVIAVLALAAANGANDNFKGVASLYSTATAGYWTCLIWGSLMTFLGALSSAWLAHALLVAFTGKGLVPELVVDNFRFGIAVASGAMLTVALAAARGWPISTTHALVGAMVGVGVIAVGMAVNFSSLGGSILLPLLASPLIAFVPAWLLAKWLRRRSEPTVDRCVCIDTRQGVVPAADAASMFLQSSNTMVMEETEQCQQRGLHPVLRRVWPRADIVHFIAAGLVSFSRGMNDTPKMAALLLPIGTIDPQIAVSLAGTAMLIGGLFGARRIADTLGVRLARLHRRPGLIASLITALLVGTASFNGLPVSTTQVVGGALAGSGSSDGTLDRRVAASIGFAWIVTLPIGLVFGAVIYALLRIA